MKRYLTAAVALTAACAGPNQAVPTPAPATAPAAQAVPEPHPPIAAWLAAFEHLFQRAGEGFDRRGTSLPYVYCIAIVPERSSSEVIAALRERIPRGDPQECDGRGSRTAPDGRPAKTFWASIVGSADSDQWIVDIGYDDLVMHMPEWRCRLTESGSGWMVSDCRQTFS